MKLFIIVKYRLSNMPSRCAPTDRRQLTLRPIASTSRHDIEGSVLKLVGCSIGQRYE
jgi:hypothetical protein